MNKTSVDEAKRNEDLVRRFYRELWGEGRIAIARELFAEDYIRHDLRPGTALPGPPGQVKIALDFREAFPDLQITLDLTIATEEFVIARWTMTGTHKGVWGASAATGRRITFSGVNIMRFEAGKVVELWNHRDDLGLMQQLGIEIYAGAVPGNGK